MRQATIRKPVAEVRPLLRVLKEELVLGQKLLGLGKAQSEALIANDAARVSAIEAESRELAARQEAMERERVAAAQALARAVGLETSSEDTPTYALTQITARLPRTDAQKLDALRREIIAVSAELVTINDRNRRLLETALDYVRFSLNTLTGLALRSPRYGANPNTIVTPTFFVDHKA